MDDWIKFKEITPFTSDWGDADDMYNPDNVSEIDKFLQANDPTYLDGDGELGDIYNPDNEAEILEWQKHNDPTHKPDNDSIDNEQANDASGDTSKNDNHNKNHDLLL